MLFRRIIELGITQPKLLAPVALFAHSKTCPVSKPQAVCPGAGGLKKKGAAGTGGMGLVRALKPGKCRLGFIPEEWFLFFKPMTGVSGPYIFMFVLGNYLVSKEIYIMEHEYYLGISIAIVLYIITTRFGSKIGAALDKEVDAIANALEQDRTDELALNKKIIKDAEDAKWRAQGQKELMDAKKENIAMQLEAVYRERLMMVFQGVRGRMDYHVKRYRAENRVHQKWMIEWILENVRKSITPEFKKQALDSAIKDLAALASRTK